MIKAAFKQSTSHLAPYERFLMGISMGSQNHTGEKLKAVVQCLNQTQLTQGVIDISDTLRRYSYMQDMPPLQARRKALQDGQSWLTKNKETLAKIKAKTHIVRWDTWLKDTRFPKYLKQFQNAYKDCPSLRSAIAKDIDRFYSRRFNDAAQDKTNLNLSIAFYLEELAVMSIQFEDMPTAQIYPGKELECLKLVRSGQVPNVPTGIQNARFFRINVYNKPANNNALEMATQQPETHDYIVS